MIPLLIVANDLEKVDEYISSVIEKYQYPPYAIHRVMSEKKELGISHIRDIQKEIAYTSAARLFILYNFQTASLEAQNAFLKTLEEKTEANHFILITPSELAVLPTIRSRVKTVRLETTDVLSVPTDIQAFMKSFADIDIGTLLSDSLLYSINTEKAAMLLDAFILWLRANAHDKRKVALIKKILETKRLLLTNNINPQLAIDNVVIFMKKD